MDSATGGHGAVNPKALAQQRAFELSSFRAHREKLERLLREGLNVQWEHALERVEEAPDSQVVLY